LEYPVEPILAAIQEKRPALTVLNLPNNPTGSEIGKDALESILAASASIGGWVVIDEAYQEFSDIGYDRADLVRNGRRVFLLRTFSKALSAAGLRIGYLIAPEAVADEMKKIVPPFHMSIFNAVAGLVLLENADLFRQRVETLKKERRRVMEALGRIPGIKVYSSSANFFLIRVRDAQELHSRLAARGVLVRRLPPDPLLEDCLRINVGTEAENDRLLKEIAGVLE
jgi:histidinol-phosphate aminotransferase